MSDPYEHGFEAARRRRLDLPPELPPERRSRWQRPGRLGWQVLVVALGVVVLLAVGRAVTARNATGLSADCSRLQLAVAEKSVPSKRAQLLHWAATGPKGLRYTVAIVSTERTGRTQTTAVQTMPAGCLAHGQFGVLVPPGRYDVVLTRVDAASSVRVAQRPVTVTAG